MHHKKKQHSKTYIHYGSKLFIPDHKLSIERWDKPAGFWSSPVSSNWGWKEFCENEDWNLESLENSFMFYLKKGTKILKIHDIKDVTKYLKKYDYLGDDIYGFNHELLKNDYDGLELFLWDSWHLRDYCIFYGWDVDSLVLWNLDKVVLL